jgi:hypothetical protein
MDPDGKKREQPDPEFPPAPLDSYAVTAIEDLAKQKFSPKDWTGNALFLGATSGLQLSGELVTQAGDRLPAVGCAGPHVGSFKNKLFKRFMFDTPHPIMLFLTDDKIDSPISTDECHFVFDANKPWDDVVRQQPLSFCVGCAAANQDALIQRLTAMGLSVLRDTQPGGHTAIIARNQLFVDQFERRIEFVPARRYVVPKLGGPALFRAVPTGACTKADTTLQP